MAVIYMPGTGVLSRPPNWATAEAVGSSVDIEYCSNCAVVTAGSNVSFGLNGTGASWDLTLIDVRGLSGNGTRDKTASTTSGTNAVTLLDSWLTATTTSATEFVVAGLFNKSTETPTLCPGSNPCRGVFLQLGSTQTEGTVSGTTAYSWPSATASFEAFATITTAAKTRGAIATFS